MNSHSDDDAPRAAIPLEYAPPAEKRSRRDQWWGNLISLIVANGVGWLLFGWLMMSGFRDDHAGPIAIGAAFITLGAGLAASLYWCRRDRPGR